MALGEGKIWLDGKLVNWQDAQVHVLSHALHYGFGVFEGIRAYTQPSGRAGIFALDEHVRRFFDSAKIINLDMPFDAATLREACLESVRVNGLDSAYIRPVAFMAEGALSIGAKNRTCVAVAAWSWGTYLGEHALEQGIRLRVSSFTRPGVNMQCAKAKATGHYVNSVLAKHEAMRDGYDEALLLDAQGFVAEASGENIFVMKGGQCITPPLGGSLLGGITRDTVIRILDELSIPLVERRLTRDELYTADELFLCGTAAEITPVRELDGRQTGEGKRGPATERVQSRYLDIVAGRAGESWNTLITEV